jgi:hypothetical protein
MYSSVSVLGFGKIFQTGFNVIGDANTCVHYTNTFPIRTFYISIDMKVSKAVPLHAMEALGGRGGIAPTHSRPRH